MQTIAALEVYARAASVATYLPLPTEVDVSGLTARAHADGKAVFLPWFNRSGELLFIGVGPDSPVERGPMGVKRPVRGQLSRLATTLDLVILPGLAFDLRGGRLGFGGGFYDRGLSQLSDGHRLAVGFDFQVVDRVPMDSGDEPMDTLVTELRVARLPSRLPDR